MLMERIEVPAPVAVRSKPDILKLWVGLAFLLAAALVMLPWALLVGFWLAFAFLCRGAFRTLREARAILLHAGEAIVGR